MTGVQTCALPISFVFGLRQLADLLEDEPEAALPFTVSVYHAVGAAGAPAEMRRLSRLFGGRWDKKPEGDSFYLIRDLGGGIQYRIRAPREAVCEKIVTGRELVRRPRQPTYDYGMEEVMEDVVEWICPEVLA